MQVNIISYYIWSLEANSSSLHMTKFCKTVTNKQMPFLYVYGTLTWSSLLLMEAPEVVIIMINSNMIKLELWWTLSVKNLDIDFFHSDKFYSDKRLAIWKLTKQKGYFFSLVNGYHFFFISIMDLDMKFIVNQKSLTYIINHFCRIMHCACQTKDLVWIGPFCSWYNPMKESDSVHYPMNIIYMTYT